MSEQDIRNESQKYLDEMMQFYSLNKNASVNTSEIPPEENNEIIVPDNNEQPTEQLNGDGETENITEKSVENISDEEINISAPEKTVKRSVEDNTEKEISFESRFPVPVIPDFIRNQSMLQSPTGAYESEEEIDSYGFLKVEVRTGENGIPVPGAAVTISQKNNGREKIIFTGTAGQSGELQKIKLPAPINTKESTPESFESYAVYTVSVFARDFYREISADVPVFAGITSIQRFNLIPLPFHYDDKGQSIINQNTEPKI